MSHTCTQLGLRASESAEPRRIYRAGRFVLLLRRRLGSLPSQGPFVLDHCLLGRSPLLVPRGVTSACGSTSVAPLAPSSQPRPRSRIPLAWLTWGASDLALRLQFSTGCASQPKKRRAGYVLLQPSKRQHQSLWGIAWHIPFLLRGRGCWGSAFRNPKS